MKAMVIETFGGSETLKLADVPAPVPGDTEVLIEVKYAAVNPVDWKIREGYLKDMFPHRFPVVLGWDAAGIVKAVGKRVKRLSVGERVFAYARKPEIHGGTYAEFVVLDENSVASMPKGLDFDAAASVPLTGLTAYQALFDFADVKAGELVLVLGGAGGVGGMAIQLAKAAGAKVIATTSAKNIDYVKSLGVDFVIDYTNKDFKATLHSLGIGSPAVVLDTVGGKTQKSAYEVVESGGRFVSIVDTPDEKTLSRRGIKSGFVFVSPSAVQLSEIARLIEAGKVKTLPLTEVRLEEVAQAHVLSQSGKTKGKIVVKIT